MPLTAFDAAALLRDVADDHPRLGLLGYGRSPPFDPGNQQTLAEFQAAYDWLETRCVRSKSPFLRAVHGLRHTLEEKDGVCCSNGILIAAAIALGIKVKRIARTLDSIIYVEIAERLPQGKQSAQPPQFHAPSETTMRQYVKFYRDGDAFAISTNATTEPDFVRGTSETIATLIESGDLAEGAEFALSQLLPEIVDVCCKLRGYKAPLVEEQRVLTAGRLAPTDTMLIAGAERAFGIPRVLPSGANSPEESETADATAA